MKVSRLACVAIAWIVLVGGCGGGDRAPADGPDGGSSGSRAAAGPPFSEGGQPATEARVKAVLERHRDAISARYDGVVGTGIGVAHPGGPPPAPDDRAFVIVVFLRDASGEPASPQALAGVPLRFIVSGEFSAQ